MAKTLPELSVEVRNCKKCPLWRSRTQSVFGEGNEKAEIMLVGEAPGYNEDRQGKPFVGTAGKLLDKLLTSINLRKENLYITNVIKSRPPGNRHPLASEVKACAPYLFEQIKIIKPKVIVTLGMVAAKALLEKDLRVAQIRGQLFKAKNYSIFPMYHPAAVLRNPTILAILTKDFLRLKECLK